MYENFPSSLSRQYPIPSEVSSWLSGKAQSILKNLLELQAYFNGRRDLPNGVKDELRWWLNLSYGDVTKILSFCSGKEWSTRDVSLMLNKGSVGLEEVLVKYGLLKETSEQKQQRESIERTPEFVEFANRLWTLVHLPPRGDARTLLNKLLDEQKIKHPLYDEASRLIDEVNLGNMLWDDYCKQIQELFNSFNVKPQEKPETR